MKVTDAARSNVSATLNITVANVNDAPAFTANPITGARATQDAAYSGSIASYASDIDTGDTQTYLEGYGPGVAAFPRPPVRSPARRTMQRRPNTFTVKVTDAAGANTTAALNFAVANINDAPVFTSQPDHGCRRDRGRGLQRFASPAMPATSMPVTR